MDHNKSYWSSLIDLKVEGWKSLSKATNAYTSSFFKPQLDESDKYVEKIGMVMKGEYHGE
jgi:hypothetical protein